MFVGKFTQLNLEFDVQERNWIRWAGGKSYLAPLWWNGCMTGKLQERAIQLSESASDSQDDIAKLDAHEFNKIVMWLPISYRNVYLAHIFNKVVRGGSIKYTKAGDVSHHCSLLGITRYRYEQLLDLTIKMIKREGCLV